MLAVEGWRAAVLCAGLGCEAGLLWWMRFGETEKQRWRQPNKQAAPALGGLASARRLIGSRACMRASGSPLDPSSWDRWMCPTLLTRLSAFIHFTRPLVLDWEGAHAMASLRALAPRAGFTLHSKQLQQRLLLPGMLRHASTTPPPKPRVLEKPDKFRPPSHPARLKSKPKYTYGPDLTQQQRTRRYPHMMPAEGTFMHWFLTNRMIHVWITMVRGEQDCQRIFSC